MLETINASKLALLFKNHQNVQIPNMTITVKLLPNRHLVWSITKKNTIQQIHVKIIYGNLIFLQRSNEDLVNIGAALTPGLLLQGAFACEISGNQPI